MSDDEQREYDLREAMRVVNREALLDLAGQTSLTSPQCREVVEAIAKGRVRHIRITY